MNKDPQALKKETTVQPDFDSAWFREELNKSPNNALHCKEALNQAREKLHERFEQGQPIADILKWNTALVDSVLCHLWAQQGTVFANMALIAVGGYGRAELHPASDIDVGILLLEPATESQTILLSQWVTSLWDLGMDIGHSVRTVDNCITEAAQDITVITNLMEARLLCGNEQLLSEMQAAISTENMWPSDAFFEAKMAEQETRHTKFHTNAYRLEPNVKESLGGLRDIQTISWVCQRQFGTQDLKDLVSNELLTQPEYEILEDGLHLLWRIRYLLHYLSKRREDRLLFDYQKDIAHSFGFTDEKNNQGIEQLMQLFYRSVMELQRLNEIILQGIGGVISGITAHTEPVPINERFQVRNGYLEVTHDQVFEQSSNALLEVFLLFGNTPSADNIRSDTVRLIRSNLHKIDDNFRANPEARALFLEIFSAPNKLTRKVRLMNQYGVMAAYIPAFDAIVGRMQYDLFHIYTVDEHTIHVIRNLRRFALPEYTNELPLGSFVAQQLERPELLYIAGLFHDIAKGRGGDHSVLGAEDAHEFCELHELTPEGTELVTWLVRHHLLMSMTAQRKDISDPAVQLEFALQVQNLRNLNHLYLLTVADIRATNPELWNSFKESLLQSLYQSTAQLLQRGLDNPVDSGDMIWQREMYAYRLLKMSDANLERDKIDALWKRLGEDYFKLYPAEEIARHTETILTHENAAVPIVALRQSESRGSTEILIYAPDHIAIFATITAALDHLQLDVQSATINTTAENFALGTFYVLESNGERIVEKTRQQQIRTALQSELSSPQDIPSLVKHRPVRRLRYFTIPTTVEFEQNTQTNVTGVHIVAADRPGILSSISRTFLRANVVVQGARIVTLGERIEDAFFVQSVEGKALDETERKLLAETLEERI